MKTRLCILYLLLSVTAAAWADGITANSIDIQKGSTVELAVGLQNSQSVGGFQFDLTLPNGISLDVDTKGIFKTELSARAGSHSLTVSRLTNGKLRFICYPANNANVTGTSGTILTMVLRAADNAAGAYQATIDNVILSDANGTTRNGTGTTFTVTVAQELQVKVNSTWRYYGDANPAFTYTVTGGTLVGEPILTCSATPTSPVGEYPIVATQGTVTSPLVNFTNGILTVRQTPLVITANSYEREVGEPNPTFRVSYERFKNGEDQGVLYQLPQVSCDADENSPAGTYEIRVTGATADNYNISYVSGWLTVKEKTSLRGDVNSDGRVSIADIVAVANYIGGKRTLTISQVDVNGDQRASIADIVAIANIIAGK